MSPAPRELLRGVRVAPSILSADFGRLREQVGEVLVGLLLPAARPDEVEQRGEGKQVSGGGGRKEMRHAVDRME